MFNLDKEKDGNYSQKKVDKHFFVHTSLGATSFVPHVYLVAEMVIRIEEELVKGKPDVNFISLGYSINKLFEIEKDVKKIEFI